ncbi:UDP-glycosyltransferase UGT5-like [Rhynchophorus ferrugineus]|uniref:UDP-glycosyltransferase UGT5-like n=1 Tax=Rhynchophorus ferrugineus TaxID=354439 RepID=UPI003FCD7ABF
MWKIALVIFSACYSVQSARYLGLFPDAGGSHYILGFKLMRALADAGHDVTFVSSIKQKKPLVTKGNFTELILEDLHVDTSEGMVDTNIFEFMKESSITILGYASSILFKSSNDTMHHPKIKQLLNSNEKYDAVVMKHSHNDALKIFSAVFNCPVIILSDVGPNNLINSVVGNPNEISYIRHYNTPGNPEQPMTFLERRYNLILYMAEYLCAQYHTLPVHQRILESVINNPPEITDLYNNVSLVLLNSHTSIYTPQPLVPNMVEIGGYHIDPPKKLPQDLQHFLDDAKDGVIYFNMGSILQGKDMPEDRKKILVNVLGRLKQKVIWKFEEDLPGKPSNMLIKKWLPQQDILAHPNIRLFITHGGLLSIIETIYHGVPILAIPVFGDQPANAERAVYSGYALKLDYHGNDFTEKRLNSLIDELLNNPKYKDNAQRTSKLFHDRPMKPLDTAVYWMEYVVRNNGARHLRVGGINLPWYQYYLVDVALFVLVPLLIGLIVIVIYIKKLVKVIVNYRYRNENEKMRKKNY